MKRIVFVTLGLASLLAFPLRGVLADGEGGSLLEKLSAETAALTAKADAHAAVLASGNRRLVGVLVGDPARFVVAIDAEGNETFTKSGPVFDLCAALAD